MAELTKIVTCLVFTAALIFLVLGYSTPWWITVYHVGADDKASLGLWLECVRQPNNKWICYDVIDVNATFNASRAMMTLALVAAAAALVAFIFWLLREPRWAGPVALSCTLGAGIFSIVGATLFAVNGPEPSFDWSFALVCVGTILFVLDGIIGLVFHLVL